MYHLLVPPFVNRECHSTLLELLHMLQFIANCRVVGVGTGLGVWKT